MLYLSYTFGNVGQLVGTALHADSEAALRGLGTRISMASEYLKNWVQQSKGKIVVDLGSSGLFCIEPEKSLGVAGLVDRLSEYFGSTMHIGIGLTAPESWQAMRQAMEKGQPYCLFEQNAETDDPQDDLMKAEAPAPTPAAEPEFDAKGYILEALQKIKAQAPVFEQLRASNPEAFEAIQRVVSAMVLMAHELSDEGGDIQKSEELWKKMRLPKPKKVAAKVEIKYPKPEAAIASNSGPENLDKQKKSDSVDPATGAANGAKWHSLRSGQVVGTNGGIVPSREPNQK